MAQGLVPATILNPPVDSWPTYHGDYSGRRHSKLTQITPQNVGSLGLGWVFQTNQGVPLSVTPLLVNGVLYITVPDNVWAVDARTGHLIWHYTYKQNEGLHIGHRGVAVYKEWVYFMTPDGHVICLEAKTGKVRWDVVVADVKKGYWTSMAPLVIRNHMMVGVSGDFDNLTGYLRSLDPETGETQWQWDSTPPPGTPNMTTGGMTWMTGTYDPDLNLIFWGTGNPTPVLNGKPRPGDNLYTVSIVALNPDTGKLAWAFREPIATLILDGKTVGRHYAGPNWDHVDGSGVTGKVASKAPGKTADDIAWLKLEVVGRRVGPTGGDTLFGTTFVQRLNTEGGLAPVTGCDNPQDIGRKAFIPYTADYFFYRQK